MADNAQKPAGGRIEGLDSLRCAMIFVVIALHAAMTYMVAVPQWWYVIDERRSLDFTILVIILDTFPMTVLFLLAGYFTPASLNRAGPVRFIQGKLLRLGLPGALGVLLVAPCLAFLSRLNYDLPPKGAAAFLREDFIGPWYQQGPYWFLGLLLFFMIWHAFFGQNTANFLIRHFRARPSGLLFCGLIVLTAAAHLFSVTCLMPADDWLNIGYVLYFQPARFAGYAAVFMLGAAAHAKGWFGENGWRPNPAAWGVFALISAAARAYWKIVAPVSLAADGGGSARMLHALGDAATYALGAVSITFFLIGLFVAAGPRFNRAMRFFNPHSFTMYWWHMQALLPIMWVFLDVPVPSHLKFIIACTGTAIVGRYLSVAQAAVFRKIKGTG